MTDGMRFSLSLHAAILALFVFTNLILKPVLPDLPKAVRVDWVGLPDKIPEHLDIDTPKSSTSTPVTKKEPIATPTPVVPNAKPVAKDRNAQKKALTKMKNLEALKELEDSEKSTAKKKFKFKGNKISPGTSLTGLDLLQKEDYRGQLDAHIKQYWKLPQFLASKNLKARLLIRINAQGNIMSIQVLQTSGVAEFDAAAKETLERALPLPLPPEKFLDILAYDGVVIDFGKGGPQ